MSLLDKLQGDLKEGLGELLDQYAWLGWSGKTSESMPWELLDALVRAVAEQIGELAGGIPASVPTSAQGDPSCSC